MPLITLKCHCGRVYDDLVGSTIQSTGDSYCPSCGSTERQERLPTKAVFRGDFGRPKDPLEEQALLENRKFQEGLILSGSRDLGEYDVTERGPDEYRPFGNDTFERKKAIEEHKTRIPNGINE